MTVTALSIRLFCFAFIQELRLSTARVIKPGIADSITAANPHLTFSVTFADFFRFDLCVLLANLLALENLSLGFNSGNAAYKSSIKRVRRDPTRSFS